MNNDTPTTLYRIYNANDVLLYVGISRNFYRRAIEHAKTQPWHRSSDHIQLEHYHTRQAAAEAEREAIRTERPAYNVVGRTRTPKIMATVRTGHPSDQLGDLVTELMPRVAPKVQSLHRSAIIAFRPQINVSTDYDPLTVDQWAKRTAAMIERDSPKEHPVWVITPNEPHRLRCLKYCVEVECSMNAYISRYHSSNPGPFAGVEVNYLSHADQAR